MNDKDKVISGLEHCSEDGCKGCPYEPDCKMCDGFSVLAKDALELINYQNDHIEAFLAEQKPVEVEYKRIDDDYQAIEDEFTCKRCGALWMIPKEDLRYCPKCGRAVKWDEGTGH